MAFLSAEHEKSKSYGTIVKTRKRMRYAGKLDNPIVRYLCLKDSGMVQDDSKTIHHIWLSKTKNKSAICKLATHTNMRLQYILHFTYLFVCQRWWKLRGAFMLAVLP
ncbi:hypothetical protein JG688_00014974 [Phytophthora aleatoria]|uniref:Uncharacterized protein n=1 Tax=Phytophthora aleatoria TaxID=2496075 RepID=A0A8J5M2Z5_9STRA|nr:hypothetical protein JG688_00014974 [Phytophthora aleatoria]